MKRYNVYTCLFHSYLTDVVDGAVVASEKKERSSGVAAGDGHDVLHLHDKHHGIMRHHANPRPVRVDDPLARDLSPCLGDVLKPGCHLIS